MEKHELWKKIEEAKSKGQEETILDDNGAEITIHMDNTLWYPDYYWEKNEQGLLDGRGIRRFHRWWEIESSQAKKLKQS